MIAKSSPILSAVNIISFKDTALSNQVDRFQTVESDLPLFTIESIISFI